MSIDHKIQEEYGKTLNQKTIDNLTNKKHLQQQYRAILDNQVDVTNQMRSSFGSMTGVEKQLNRAELKAWKAYDTKPYSLIPGVHHGYLGNNRRSIDVATSINNE